MRPGGAYEGFIFAKEEFLDGISMVSVLLIASHWGETSYFHA